VSCVDFGDPIISAQVYLYEFSCRVRFTFACYDTVAG